MKKKNISQKESINILSLVAKIIILLIIVLLVYDFIVYKKVKESEEENFVQLGNYVTSQTCKAISDWVSEQVTLAEYIAEDTKIIDACVNPKDIEKRETAVALIEKINQKFIYQENIGAVLDLDYPIKIVSNGRTMIINSNTVFIDSVGGKTLGKRYETMPHLKDVFKGNSYFISEAYNSVLRKNPIIIIAVPVKYNDEVIGAVFLAPQLVSFSTKFLDTSLKNDTGYLFLGDERGLVIAHKNKEYVLNPDITKISEFSKIANRVTAGDNLIYGRPNGVKKQYYSQEIVFDRANVQQKIFTVFTMDEVHIYRNSLKIMFFSSVVLLIGVLVIAFIVYDMVKNNHKKNRELDLIRLKEELEEKVEIRTKQLKDMAERDSLTGCLNHNAIYGALDDMVKTAFQENQSFAIAMLDLDYFKHINDTYGHPKGDEVIMTTARIIKESIRSEDYLGRYGGEEFMILMPQIDLEQAVKIAERVRKNVSQNIFHPEGFGITVSIGVCANFSHRTIELVNNADRLMYEAKKGGRNKVVSSVI